MSNVMRKIGSKAMETTYHIRNSKYSYWNAEAGRFGPRTNATVFTWEETDTVKLPHGGEWVEIPIPKDKKKQYRHENRQDAYFKLELTVTGEPNELYGLFVSLVKTEFSTPILEALTYYGIPKRAYYECGIVADYGAITHGEREGVTYGLSTQADRALLVTILSEAQFYRELNS